MNAARAIRTPDQRLRIFVSSTLKELAPERRAARAAIERLHLAPVMFELGARPHPPRELYRAYLEQSDVFVGLYWERYGWVAPDETVSGLEDEYDLCPPDLPRLLYIKDPAPNREPRLRTLLDRIRDDDRASFKYFETARELGALLEADLATLLAERFDLARLSTAPAVDSPPERRAEPEQAGAPSLPAPLPRPLTDLVGRDRELGRLQRLIEDGARLVTVTGPGGIGKSRLAIATGTALADRFPDGVAFVALSGVHDPAAVPATIAQAVGVRDTGEAPIAVKLVAALRDRRMLLVLDNFEQVLEGAPELVGLLAEAPGVSVIVTSRSLLRVGGERSFELGPLPVEQAVALFVERAHAVKPDFEITPDNAAAVDRIVAALDGVPLALELAAARMRVLTATELSERLDRRLPLLVGGSRDLPQRQQTLRSTIEWSTQLLAEPERRLLACLGVFEGGFTLDAAEHVVTGRIEPGGPPPPDTLSGLDALVDGSLLSQRATSDRPRFRMLATVREYALEKLAEEGGLDRARDLHADYYLDLAARAALELEGPRQAEWVRRLAEDDGNLRAAERRLLERRDGAAIARLAWSLYLYRWIAGRLGEVKALMEELLATAEAGTDGDGLDDLTRATALYFTHAIGFWQDPDGSVAAGLAESAQLFHEAREARGEALALISLALALLAAPQPDIPAADAAMETSRGLFHHAADGWGEAMAMVVLGRVALLRQQVPEALREFEGSLTLARQHGDELGVSIAQHHRGWARLLLGDPQGAAADFAECLELSQRLGHTDGIAYALEGMVAVAAVTGDAARAGRLLGATRALRDRTGLHNAAAFSFHQFYVDRLAETGAAAALTEAAEEGRQMSVAEAVEVAQGVALQVAGASAAAPGSAP
ncbi:DUF4062 domain-containing protein [Leifsonia sp. F6_8S_P_1B]|uniref:DUF4062 domain-containing protein n=1 Tax=Leifsonia williamsii TaxID=3035919 RepID=A0ABT8K8X1_9MICO|nr:DUF4062 domain-containing protein [Leifsonia williamsii]MDN4613920.1 DUF4062 domain-containing protein [Leifsonia williamsii]